MSQIVHRLCAEVVVDRNGQRLFPIGKKKIPQKEVRLVEINKSPPGKPGWKTGRLEIGGLAEDSEKAEWATGLEALWKIDKQLVDKGNLILTLKRTTTVPTLNFQSMDEITMIIFRQADPQNLTTLITMIHKLMTTGSVRDRESLNSTNQVAKAGAPLNSKPGVTGGGISKAQEPQVAPASKWALPKELEQLGQMPNQTKVVSKISLREHRLMKMGVSDEEDDYEREVRPSKKVLPSKHEFEEIKPERARFELLFSQLLLHRILEYLSAKEASQLGLINKKCHALYSGMRRELNYSRFAEVPEAHLLSLVKKCNRVEKIVWGKMLGFKSNPDKFSGIKATSLLYLDCSVMNDFKDSTVVMFARFAPNLKEFSVPYYSLTSHSMLMMIKEFPRLEAFRALHFTQHRSMGVINEKISSKSVSEFLFTKQNLKELEFFALDVTSLSYDGASPGEAQVRLSQKEGKLDSYEPAARSSSTGASTVRILMKTLKIHNLLSRSLGSLSTLEALGSQFPALQSLTLGSIYMTPFNLIPSCPTAAMVSVLNKLPQTLTTLALGEFVDDGILAAIPKGVRELAVSSPQVTDEGFNELLKKIAPRRLDLRGSHLISWEAFKSLEPPAAAAPAQSTQHRGVSDGEKFFGQSTTKTGLREVILKGEKSRAEEIQQFLQEKGVRGCRVVNYEPTRT